MASVPTPIRALNNSFNEIVKAATSQQNSNETHKDPTSSAKSPPSGTRMVDVVSVVNRIKRKFHHRQSSVGALISIPTPTEPEVTELEKIDNQQSFTASSRVRARRIQTKDTNTHEQDQNTIQHDGHEQYRRLGAIASYSPYAVSLPILLDSLPLTSRFNASASSFFGVVVLSDISGFTKLSEALALGHEPWREHQRSDSATIPANNSHQQHTNKSQQQRRHLQRQGADTLVTIINSVFSRLIDVIISHGGDILKFAGDALLSVWRPDSDSYEDRRSCCLRAAVASLRLQNAMSNFSSHGVSMTLHSALSCGELVEVHVGGFRDRWEYLCAGQPINDMGRAMDVSKSGDVIVHCSLWEYIHTQADGFPVEHPKTKAAEHSNTASTSSSFSVPNSVNKLGIIFRQILYGTLFVIEFPLPNNTLTVDESAPEIFGFNSRSLRAFD